MNAENFSVAMLMEMRHSAIPNYIIPGVTSCLIGNPSERGTIRTLECSREHQESVTPHSHRFDFQCWVLRGSVRNRIWSKSYDTDKDADWFQETELEYQGAVGGYKGYEGAVGRWKFTDKVYATGDCYSMKREQVHSIFFSRWATVLFFEGPHLSNKSTIIEPFVNDKRIPTFKVEPWMFS